MHRTVRVSAQAAVDMEKIFDWTRRRFGETHELRYAHAMGRALQFISDCESLYFQKRQGLKAEVRVFLLSSITPRSRHLMLLRLSGEHHVDVGRVLHDAMDLPKHVPRSWQGIIK